MDTHPIRAGEAGDYDVAVVGGGIGGVYTAWRLREATGDDLGPELRELADRRADKRLRVGLFEYGGRIGGRLFSLDLPGIQDTPVELGGMRFLNIHRRVAALVVHFKLNIRRLEVEDPGGKNLYYLRGQHFTQADWDRPDFAPPYRLERGERSRSPGQLLNEAVLRHRDRVEQHPERYRDIGFWNLLLDDYSDQAYGMMRDAGGYETIVNNWSAAAAIPFLLADFAPGSTYYRLRKGFEELPRQVEARYRAAGGEVYYHHRLHRLDHDGSSIHLTFDRGAPDQFRYRRGPKGEAALTSRARHVVLAMPRRSIEGLHPDSFIFDSEQFQKDVRAVLPQPGFKIFAAYRRPWWKEARGVSAGRSVTDLPVRQCYYWVTGAAAGKGNSNSVLMASYNDGSSVEFWAGLMRRPERYQAPPEACPPGVPIPDDLRGALASAPLVEEMQNQLRELHGLSELTDPAAGGIVSPYVAVCQDWTQEPFGGGWHFWKIGEDAPRVRRRMQRPVDGASLYVCGEAWSSQQGWVEGALETADEVLEKQLRVPTPEWLHKLLTSSNVTPDLEALHG